MRLTRSSFNAAALAALAAPSAAGAQAPGRPLRIIFFPGGDALALYVGVRQGFFARENLAVALTPTPGSVYQFQHLSAGDFDVAMTAIDNAIAYDEGQGEAALPNPADFVAFYGAGSALLRLYARPDITSYADLKGKTLAVDAVSTGYAFVLRAQLEKNGVADAVTLKPLGGTPARLKALVAGDCAATLLSAPYDLQAAAQGMHQLGDIMAATGPYQGVVAVARKPWLAQNQPLTASFVRAMIASLNWIYDPSNMADAAALLAQTAKVSPSIAAEMLPAIVQARGTGPVGRVDLAAVKTVLALRSRYGRPQRLLTDPARYVDEGPYRAATAG